MVARLSGPLGRAVIGYEYDMVETRRCPLLTKDIVFTLGF